MKTRMKTSKTSKRKPKKNKKMEDDPKKMEDEPINHNQPNCYYLIVENFFLTKDFLRSVTKY
jgi:hypothetical protein